MAGEKLSEWEEVSAPRWFRDDDPGEHQPLNLGGGTRVRQWNKNPRVASGGKDRVCVARDASDLATRK